MSRRLSLNHMNNLEKIKSFNENEMVDFLNYIMKKYLYPPFEMGAEAKP